MNFKTESQLRTELSQVWAMLEAEREYRKWQPIETAPIDGTWIQAWRKHGVKPIYVKFDSVYGEFENEGGDHEYHLTHWMPLPAPPAGA